MEEDDGALSEIEPDSVPNEVRDWLAMTFTRSMSTIKRRPSDKPKFKSVAQAIRAGIMVDRCVIYFNLFLSFFFDLPTTKKNKERQNP
jgi:calcium/calmodulin-dependent 3',5'-cyclic nucleotide phosphodiesterase